MAAEPGEKGGLLRVPTPGTSHLGDEQFKDVYEPSEDSFLLMDALQQDAGTLKLLEPKTVLEMGQHLALHKQNSAASLPVFFAVDKQREAVHATRLTLELNNPGVSFELLCCDLFGAFKRPSFDPSTDPCAVGEHGKRAETCSQGNPVLGGPFDLIIFNPPYVPGSPRAVVDSGDLPWWGGTSGREVIDSFVDKVTKFLSPRGILYLVRTVTHTLNEFGLHLPRHVHPRHINDLSQARVLISSLQLLERRNKPEEVISMLEATGCTGQEGPRRAPLNLAVFAGRLAGHSLLG
ncbi:hypothetical protein ACSSS7_004022 [Eimeria intestinalis]